MDSVSESSWQYAQEYLESTVEDDYCIDRYDEWKDNEREEA